MGKRIPDWIKVIGRRPDGTKEDATNVPVGEWGNRYDRVDVYYGYSGEPDTHAHAVFKRTDQGFEQVYTRTRKGSQVWDTGK